MFALTSIPKIIIFGIDVDICFDIIYIGYIPNCITGINVHRLAFKLHAHFYKNLPFPPVFPLNDHRVDVLFLDILLDQGTPLSAAEAGMRLHRNAGFTGNRLQAIHVQNFTDAASRAEIRSIYLIH